VNARRPRFSEADRARFTAARIALAIVLDEWTKAGAPAGKVVQAVEELMRAAKILREP
jgi:hypothetical protein